jgi:hypothetical protein
MFLVTDKDGFTLIIVWFICVFLFVFRSKYLTILLVLKKDIYQEENLMQTVILEISDDVKDVILSFLRILPSDTITIYEEVDNFFTEEDAVAYQTALIEKNEGESISLETLKLKYAL